MGLLWNMLEKVKILTVVFLVKIPLESVAKKVHFSISFNLPHCFQRHIFSYHRLLYTKKNLIMCLFSMRNMSLIGQSIPMIPARKQVVFRTTCNFGGNFRPKLFSLTAEIPFGHTLLPKINQWLCETIDHGLWYWDHNIKGSRVPSTLIFYLDATFMQMSYVHALKPN